jgi:type II secretory pathway pseudopilin PulG
MKCRRWVARDAFTLVEVLLTMVLAAALLMALWSLLSMYTKVFEGGHARTEQSQLARTLLEEITADLQSVLRAAPPVPPLPIVASLPPTSADDSPSTGTSQTSPSSSSQPSVSAAGAAQPIAPVQAIKPVAVASPQSATLPPAPAFGGTQSTPSAGGMHAAGTIATTSLRPAGLFGTDTFLQMDVLQPALAQLGHENDEAMPVDSQASPRVGELKTVTYSFEEMDDPDRPLAEPMMHLVRREMSWAKAHPPARSGAGLSGQPDFRRVTQPSEFATDSEEMARATRSNDPPPETSQTSVPEVMHFAMRYFDGAAWSDEWDSMARRRLPVAVEVTMRLRSYNAATSTQSAGAVDDVDEEKVVQWKHPAHRLLIPLAVAAGDDEAGNSPSGGSLLRVEDPFGADAHGGLSQQ